MANELIINVTPQETRVALLEDRVLAELHIERTRDRVRVDIHTARPGVVIGKKGADIDKLRKRVADITSSDVVINIVEIRKPEIDAKLVAQGIADQGKSAEILRQNR